MASLRPAKPADIPHLTKSDSEPHVHEASGVDGPKARPALLGGSRSDWAVLVDPLPSNEGVQRFHARPGYRTQGRFRFGLDDCSVMRCSRFG